MGRGMCALRSLAHVTPTPGVRLGKSGSATREAAETWHPAIPLIWTRLFNGSQNQKKGWLALKVLYLIALGLLA